MDENKPSRTVYFDYMRVLATFAVVVLHVSSQNWHDTDITGYQWQVFNTGVSLCRWAVPVFVMISGALFLSREIPLRKLYSKYILRMAVAFVTWSVFYALTVTRAISEINVSDNAVIDAYENLPLPIIIMRGHYHMWFILMIIGVYMCIPLIKPIVESDDRIRYFLLLAFIFVCFTPEMITLMKDFGNETVIQYAEAFEAIKLDLKIYIVMGYVAYFVLGYYLSKTEISQGMRIAIYILGIAGAVFTVLMTETASLKYNEANTHYYGNFNLNILFMAVAVFTFFKARKFNLGFLNTVMQKLSKYSFGAYLAHVFFLERLDYNFGINTLTFDPVASVLQISLGIFLASMLVSAILNQIPLIKRYLV